MAVARRLMSHEEARAFVLGLLGDGKPRKTQEVDAAANERGKKCPDSTVKFLARLRLEGVVEGRLDPATGTWLWWAPRSS